MANKQNRKNIVKLIVFVVLLGLSLFMLWWLWAAGPETIWRIISSDTSSIEDYKIFPARKLTASESPFLFVEGVENARVPATITVKDSVQPLDMFLLDNDTTAFLLIKDDVILMENYYKDYGKASPTLAFSMSKSFLSILIGMAIEDGLIASTDLPVTEYVPELAAAGFSKVTINHLLQMTSGMDYVEVEGSDTSLHTRFYYTNRLEYECLRLDLEIEPGQDFSYKSGDNALLGLILSRAIAPQTITGFVQERLWEPLGMEFAGAWNLDHADGLEKTWCCLSATARDFAKLGRLMLQEGNWEGVQLISEDWVRKSTLIDTSKGSVWNYQYQWWLATEDGGDFMAMGHLGQFVYVNPAENMVIVRLGTSRGGLTWEEWTSFFVSLSEVIE